MGNNKRGRIRPAIVLIAAVLVALAISVLFVEASSSTYSVSTTVQRSNVPSVQDSTIAVDPANSSYMFQSEAVGGTGLGFYSLDGGKTWHPPVSAPSLGINDDPSIGIDQNGVYYDIEHSQIVSNSTFNDGYAVAYLEYSTDHGKDWALDNTPYASLVTNTTLNAVQTTWTLLNGTKTQSCYLNGYNAVGDYQKIAVDSNPNSPYVGNIYIIGNFAVLRENSCIVQVGFVRSSDGGKSWDEHVVTNPDLTSNQVEKIAVRPNGEIYFVRNNGGTGINSILFEKSTDAGATWTHSVLSNTSQISGNVAWSPTIAVSQTGTLGLAYISCLTICNMTRNGSSAVFLITSSDDGSSWSSYARISDGGAMPFWTYLPFPPSECNPFISCVPERSEIAMIYGQLGLSVVWRDWRNAMNGSMTDIYGYIPSLSSSNIRITPQTEFICYFPYERYCNDFGGTSDFLSVASSKGGLFVAYGLDSGNSDHMPDSLLASIEGKSPASLGGIPIPGGEALMIMLVGIGILLIIEGSLVAAYLKLKPKEFADPEPIPQSRES